MKIFSNIVSPNFTPMKKFVSTTVLLPLFSALLVFMIFTSQIKAQVSAASQEEILIPDKGIFITPPPYFQLMTSENGEAYLYHPATNAVIQFMSRPDLPYVQADNLFTDSYFKEQNMQLLMKQNPEMIDGSSSSLYICSARYKSNDNITEVDYSVLIFTGGNDKTFIVTARFPELAKELLMNEIMNSFFTIRWAE